MPQQVPHTQTFENTSFRVEGIGNVVETHMTVKWDAEKDVKVKTDQKGNPNRLVSGAYKGTAEIELGEYESGLLIEALDDPLGGQITASGMSEPTDGESTEFSLPLVVQKISAAYEKEEENMHTISFLHAGIMTFGGKELSLTT